MLQAGAAKGLKNTNCMHGHVDALQTTKNLALRADFCIGTPCSDWEEDNTDDGTHRHSKLSDASSESMLKSNRISLQSMAAITRHFVSGGSRHVSVNWLLTFPAMTLMVSLWHRSQPSTCSLAHSMLLSSSLEAKTEGQVGAVSSSGSLACTYTLTHSHTHTYTYAVYVHLRNFLFNLLEEIDTLMHYE